MAESFFSSLKTELIDEGNYASLAQATSSIEEYIDLF